jgi:hypothetical protein
MPSQRGFGDDGTKATRFYKPDDSDDQMNENDEDIVHPGIVSNLKKPWQSFRSCISPPTPSRLSCGCVPVPARSRGASGSQELCCVRGYDRD